jgi:signal transduction histidine kinase
MKTASRLAGMLGAGAAVYVAVLAGARPLAPALVAALAVGVTATAADGGGRRQRQQQATLRSTLQDKEDQLANTAHDLRTPLTALSSAVELIREGYATTPEDRDVFLNQAATAARHMAFLINDVIDLAAADHDRLQFNLQPLHTNDLLVDALQILELTSQARGVQLVVEPAPTDAAVLVDHGRFLQIAFNLASNAIKYSRPGDRVWVRARTIDTKIRVEIQDEGPGIPADMQHVLFQRFGRAHARTRPDVPGTGIGLFMCRLLVERMGGRIGYDRASPRGSIFWFELPPAAVSTEDRETRIGSCG